MVTPGGGVASAAVPRRWCPRGDEARGRQSRDAWAPSGPYSACTVPSVLMGGGCGAAGPPSATTTEPALLNQGRKFVMSGWRAWLPGAVSFCFDLLRRCRHAACPGVPRPTRSPTHPCFTSSSTHIIIRYVRLTNRKLKTYAHAERGRGRRVRSCALVVVVVPGALLLVTDQAVPAPAARRAPGLPPRTEWAASPVGFRQSELADLPSGDRLPNSGRGARLSGTPTR